MNTKPIYLKHSEYKLLGIVILLLVSISQYVLAATPPFGEGTRNFTLLNGSGVDTVQFGTNENVTIQFLDTVQHTKAELTVHNYDSSTTYLKKQSLTETNNGDGTYTYAYTFNTNTLLGGVADWYYFFIDMKSAKASVFSHFIVGSAATPHRIRTFSDASYATEAEEFSISDTVYVEVIGNDNGKDASQKKITITDYDDTKYINGNIGSVTISSGVFRFAVDLSSPNKAFANTDWWHSMAVQIKQKGSGQESFLGYKQIKVLPVTPVGAGKWIQQKWRELE